MNFFKKLFKRKKNFEVPNIQTEYIPSEIKNFKYFYNSEEIEPRIILNYKILKQLLNKQCQVALSWNLAYSSFRHGFSLKTMRMFLLNYKPPFLFVIKDINHNIFGVFLDDKVEIKNGISGNIETFLFKVKKLNNVENNAKENPNENDKKNYLGDEIVKYSATLKNSYYCKSAIDYIAFGVANGYHGLFLSSDLQSGESHTVETFDNEVLGNNHFFIQEIEVWSINL